MEVEVDQRGWAQRPVRGEVREGFSCWARDGLGFRFVARGWLLTLVEGGFRVSVHQPRLAANMRYHSPARDLEV